MKVDRHTSKRRIRPEAHMRRGPNQGRWGRFVAAWLLATGSGCGHALEHKDYDTEAVQRNVVVEGPEGSTTLEEVDDFGSSYQSSYLILSFPGSADALDSDEFVGFRKVEVRNAPALGETLPIDHDPYFCDRFSGTIRGIMPDPSLFAGEGVEREERHFDGHRAYSYEITCDELRVAGEVHMAIYYTWRTHGGGH